jgi:hypothetical protein
MDQLRDTKYATEIASSIMKLPSGAEARIERLRVKSSDQVEIRMSWWKDGRMMMRPLDLPESDFLKLIAQGIRDGVLLPPDHA